MRCSCWASCSRRAGIWPARRTAYERAIRARSGSAVAHDKLGFVLGRQERIPEALAEFARAIKLDPTLFDAQYHLGATRWWTRDLQGAMAPLRAAVRLRPDHPEARYYLGATLRQLGQPARGSDRSCAKRSGWRRRSLRHICSSGSRSRRSATSMARVASLKRAVALDPSVPDALNSLGLALMQSGNGAGGRRDVPAS